LGELPGVHIAARYVAASAVAEVGGDFYDVVRLDEHRIALAIGDVQGHDMTAAMVMGGLRSAIRAYLLITQDPAEVLRLVDHYAIEQSHARLATTCLAVLDSDAHTIDVATAGHPLPYLAYQGGVAAPLTVPPSRPLGVGGGEFFLERHVLPRAGTLVFFTDGLIDEGRSGAGGRIRTLTSLLEESPSQDPEAMADAILKELTVSGARDDDLAILVAMWSFL
jgi:serine phosphatase RsbU (regulator of sigma subunit)